MLSFLHLVIEVAKIILIQPTSALKFTLLSRADYAECPLMDPECIHVFRNYNGIFVYDSNVQKSLNR